MGSSFCVLRSLIYLYGLYSLWLMLLSTLGVGSSCLYWSPSVICTVSTDFRSFLSALCVALEGPLWPVYHCFILITSHDRKDDGCVQMMWQATTDRISESQQCLVLVGRVGLYSGTRLLGVSSNHNVFNRDIFPCHILSGKYCYIWYIHRENSIFWWYIPRHVILQIQFNIGMSVPRDCHI